ncbi:MAG: hypothetical protein GY865_03225 [candidate division Zixibacteria bacterium]|nr:hypothetical protein [candidate division Zixibacteria bacterium]
MKFEAIKRYATQYCILISIGVLLAVAPDWQKLVSEELLNFPRLFKSEPIAISSFDLNAINSGASKVKRVFVMYFDGNQVNSTEIYDSIDSNQLWYSNVAGKDVNLDTTNSRRVMGLTSETENKFFVITGMTANIVSRDYPQVVIKSSSRLLKDMYAKVFGISLLCCAIMVVLLKRGKTQLEKGDTENKSPVEAA